ncbi:Rne/Rng family ribonuclease [Zafaria sp. Z1313]|uniref:Rne/Rng family ribonuclease n=1 Tax=Zafaria sp. Z1313 TaxID=3423202 RepID=UPI003D302336
MDSLTTPSTENTPEAEGGFPEQAAPAAEPKKAVRRRKPAAKTAAASAAEEGETAPGVAAAEAPASSEASTAEAPAEAPAKATRRRSSTAAKTTTKTAAAKSTPAKKTAATQATAAKKTATGAEASVEADPVAAIEPALASGDGVSDQLEEPAAKAPRKRAPRKSAVTVPDEAPAPEVPADGAAEGDAPTEAAPARKAPRKRTPRKATAAAQGDDTGAEAPDDAAAAQEAAAVQPPASPAADEAPGAGTGVVPGSSDATTEDTEGGPAADPFTIPASPVSLLFHAPDLTAVPAPAAVVEDEEDDDADSGEEGAGRRRRGRRTRRTRGGASEEAAANGPAGEEEGVVSRRRRRRRRGDADLELTGGQDDDPPNTVTRVRGPRQAAEPAPSNKVMGVKGSTRLEAKRQRRRESRESGRRRHVITEAEFLARRESVDRQMVVRQREDRIQIGVLEDGILAEHFVSKTQQDSLIGNVYVGKVQNVLPSMEAAFIDIGRGRNAVLYAGEVNWDVAGLDGQPRKIEHALKSGDSVLVQVTKDPVGHKGARLTSQISLPGRYLVYVPGGSMTGISRKLPDVERNRLKKILKDHLPQNAGVIVRTAAEGASEEELMNDINRLRALWEEIERKSTSTKTTPPELLYGEPDLTIKVVRDVFNEDFSKLVVSGEEAWDTIEAYVTYVAPDLLGRLEKWEAEEDIFAANRIDEQIHKALDRKVFLPSGGSLVIDRTEAMTVVDVNTGKFTGSGGNLEETVTKNNLEAAEEIVRQLRLRDIGGIIVIDFIDMVLEANRDLVLRRLVECLGRDRTKHQVAEVTSLGLVQMTRKRMGTGLLEVFSENCEACNGRGVVTHEEPVEHRRSYTASGEQQSGSRNDRNDRSGRSSRRRKGGKDQDAPEQPVEAQRPAEDPEREAKASAARAAFATIAAAAHAAHEHEHDAGARPEAATEGATGGSAPADGAASGDAEAEAGQAGTGGRRGRRRRGRAGSPVTTTGGAADAPAGDEAPADAAERPDTTPVQAGEALAAPAAPTAAASVSETSVPAPEEAAEQVVTIAGEAVRLPRARRSRRATAPVQAPELTLESLSEVLGALAPDSGDGDAGRTADAASATTPGREPAGAVESTDVVEESGVVAAADAAAEAAPGRATQPESVAVQEAAQPEAPAPRRPRRTRSARSAQGSAHEPIERGVAAAPASGGSTHTAALPGDTAARAAAPAEAPVVLGVGVPASEL